MQRQVGKQCFVVFLVLIKGFVTGGRLGLLKKKVSRLEDQYEFEVASQIKELKNELSKEQELRKSMESEILALKEAGRTQLNGITPSKRAHGGWAMWNSWTTCTSNCGTGLTHRRRDCNSPPPSLFGEYCHGDTVEYKLCVERQCPTTSFAVYWPSSDTYSSGDAIIFTEIINNDGGGYNSSTGKFTASVRGQYLFSLTVVEGSSRAGVTLMENHQVIGVVHPEAAGTDDDTASVTVVVNLYKGDTVWARFSGGIIHTSYMTSFTGVLIHP